MFVDRRLHRFLTSQGFWSRSLWIQLRRRALSHKSHQARQQDQLQINCKDLRPHFSLLAYNLPNRKLTNCSQQEAISRIAYPTTQSVDILLFLRHLHPFLLPLHSTYEEFTDQIAIYSDLNPECGIVNPTLSPLHAPKPSANSALTSVFGRTFRTGLVNRKRPLQRADSAQYWLAAISCRVIWNPATSRMGSSLFAVFFGFALGSEVSMTVARISDVR